MYIKVAATWFISYYYYGIHVLMDVIKYILDFYFKTEMFFNTSSYQREYLEESTELFTLFIPCVNYWSDFLLFLHWTCES